MPDHPSIEAQLILCDAAAADATTGKIHMLGAGWSITGSPTGPHALAVLIKIPWHRANEQLKMIFELLNSDGQPVTQETPSGRQRVRHEGSIELGRPPGLAHGSTLDASFALNVVPMNLPPGRYQWRLKLAEQLLSVFFTVRDASG